MQLIPRLERIYINSRNLVLATGGKQKVEKNFHKKYELKKSTKVLTSDEVLRETQFKSLLKLIKERDGNIKIKIIGGSHSAFSIAWLLLNGPAKLKEFVSTYPR